MTRYYRKVIRIRAEDSPNVRYGMLQQAQGMTPTNELIVEGVLPYHDYLKRRATWDRVRQCIGLDGDFYEGPENLMFPPEWLNLCEQRADELKGVRRKATALGVDTAQGGDDTVWSVIDELGLMYQEAQKTKDTAVIPGRTIALAQQYGVEPENIMFDQGGGGQEHADRLRKQGYEVRTVNFGAAASTEPKRWNQSFDERIVSTERRYTYKNKRAEMYHLLRLRMDPADGSSFALPAAYTDLRQQLAPIPLLYGEEGKIWLPPKNKRDANDTRPTLTEMLGRSPDHADSLVTAVYVLHAGDVALRLGVAF